MENKEVDNGKLRHSHAENLVVVVMFCCFMALPLIGWVFHLGTTSKHELRVQENRVEPPLKPLRTIYKDPTEYFTVVEERFNDEFGFRKPLLFNYNRLVYHGLGASPIVSVNVGRDGWLYYVGEVNYYQSTPPFTDQQLQRWASILESRRLWLASHGIDYLVVMPPNKSTVYPEHLQKTVIKTTPLRLDQFYAYMGTHTQVRFVDLRPALFKAKATAQIYSKLDTHWNDMGAFTGAGEIDLGLHGWFPRVTAPRLLDYTVKIVPANFDLARMLGTFSNEHQKYVALVPNRPRLARNLATDPSLAADGQYSTVVANVNLPTAVVFHDSFMDALHPFLSEQFRRADYLKLINLGSFDGAFVLRHHPSVVIQEVVERSLADDMPDNNTLGSELPTDYHIGVQPTKSNQQR